MITLADPAAAASGIDLPAGRLGDVILLLARQADISIGMSDPALAALPVRAVTGAATARRALARLLAGTPAEAITIDANTFRIVRRRPRSERLVPPPSADPIRPAEGQIIVTASKRDTRLGRFPGTAILLDGAAFGTGRAGGTDAIVSRLPTVSSTHLGPARNKLFIRGVADSSFNGPAQATVGEYLGDVRLNYNAPDPDLTLYDVDRVEVLEGPQGTLYGAGSLGGIVRLVPVAPKLDQIGGSLSLGHRLTAHGTDSGDAAGMVNLPLLGNHAGLRLVAYRSAGGGYIDDAGRRLSDINRTRTVGGRATLRVAPGHGWTIDAGVVLQNINSRDSQYAERGLARLTRASAIAQPFDNDYLLGQVTATKAWDGDLRLTSASSIVRHQVSAQNDATPRGGSARVFEQDNHILLASNETRLTRTRADGTGWLIGATVVSDTERLTRGLGPPGALTRITGVRNAIIDLALYSELTLGLTPRLQLTGGGRLGYARLAGEGLDVARHSGAETTRTEVEVLPSLGLTWVPAERLVIFARYQEGFRPGGLSVGGAASTLAVQRFQGDSIGTIEAGFRLGDAGRGRWSATTTFSYGHWEHIQADLVGTNGLPFSANIGTGRVLGMEASGMWRAIAGLTLEAALFLNDSRLDNPAAGFGTARKADLPNIGDLGGRVGADYTAAVGSGVDLTLGGSARYVGRSTLGVGPLLDIPQGRYVDTTLSARLERGLIGTSVTVSNLFDAQGNRFSLGNPFGVTERRQITPLRRRSVRLGLDLRF
jgi:iron complex outermembrane receptor protein